MSALIEPRIELGFPIRLTARMDRRRLSGQVHAKSGFLIPTRKNKMRDEEGFIISHYAGQVIYHCASTITKATGNAEVGWTKRAELLAAVGATPVASCLFFCPCRASDAAFPPFGRSRLHVPSSKENSCAIHMPVPCL